MFRIRFKNIAVLFVMITSFSFSYAEQAEEIPTINSKISTLFQMFNEQPLYWNKEINFFFDSVEDASISPAVYNYGANLVYFLAIASKTQANNQTENVESASWESVNFLFLFGDDISQGSYIKPEITRYLVNFHNGYNNQLFNNGSKELAFTSFHPLDSKFGIDDNGKCIIYIAPKQNNIENNNAEIDQVIIVIDSKQSIDEQVYCLQSRVQVAFGLSSFPLSNYLLMNEPILDYYIYNRAPNLLNALQICKNTKGHVDLSCINNVVWERAKFNLNLVGEVQ